MPELVAVEAALRRLERVVVAFSGGADSAFLAWVAHNTPGVEARSPPPSSTTTSMSRTTAIAVAGASQR